MQSNQVHIDLETLDTRHTSRILSIGAVIGTEFFYEEIDQSSYGTTELVFTTSNETVAWWDERGGFQPTKEALSVGQATHKFALWFGTVTDGMDDVEVWANAPTFDCSMMLHHFKFFSINAPWAFWQERDVRTVKGLYRTLGLNIQKYNNPHHALEDAINQQKMVDSVIMTLAKAVQHERDHADERQLDLPNL